MFNKYTELNLFSYLGILAIIVGGINESETKIFFLLGGVFLIGLGTVIHCLKGGSIEWKKYKNKKDESN